MRSFFPARVIVGFILFGCLCVCVCRASSTHNMVGFRLKIQNEVVCWFFLTYAFYLYSLLCIQIVLLLLLLASTLAFWSFLLL